MASFYRSSCHPSILLTAGALILGAGCRDDPTFEEPAPLGTDTDVVSEPVGDTDADTDTDTDTDGEISPTKVCRTSPSESTPGQTVVWLCDGYAESRRVFEIDEAAAIAGLRGEIGEFLWVSVGGTVTNFVNGLEDLGDTNYDQFGPNYDGYQEAAERKQVVACCEDGYDYPNTVQPDNVGDHGDPRDPVRERGCGVNTDDPAAFFWNEQRAA